MPRARKYYHLRESGKTDGGERMEDFPWHICSFTASLVCPVLSASSSLHFDETFVEVFHGKFLPCDVERHERRADEASCARTFGECAEPDGSGCRRFWNGSGPSQIGI
jgi:hypothetical protein